MNVQAPQNTENKSEWVKWGQAFEVRFIERVCPRLGLMPAEINPEKKSNPYAPDLLIQGVVSELKSPREPFFKVRQLYDRDPQYAVTFNQKDYQRYVCMYPFLPIYFWVHWSKRERVVGGAYYRVNPMTGVWLTSMRELKDWIESGVAPLHEYERRKNLHDGNGKYSYVLDVRMMTCIRAVGMGA